MARCHARPRLARHAAAAKLGAVNARRVALSPNADNLLIAVEAVRVARLAEAKTVAGRILGADKRIGALFGKLRADSEP